MIKPESVRRRDIRNDNPEKPISSGNNIFALREKFVNTSLKNRNKTPNGRWNSMNGRDERLNDLQERVTAA
jgi:hypothetical protein